MSAEGQTSRPNVREAASALLQGALKHTQAARLAAALIPLAAVPMTLTDGLHGPQPAFGQSGGSPVLQTLTIPADAQCAAGSGSASGRALAVIAGGRVGLPQFKSLLITSCNDFGAAAQARLHFIDPKTSTRVKSLTTTVTPPGGWDALAFRVDKGDLLACADAGVYRIDISPFNTAVDGTAIQMGALPGGTSCAGLGWDHTTQKVYQIDGGEGQHARYSLPETGVAAPAASEAFRPGSCGSFGVTGVAVAGPSVFVGCLDGPEVNWLSKNVDTDEVPGAPFRFGDFSTLPLSSPFSPADVECDPITFQLTANNSEGFANRDAVWVKDEFAPTVRALPLPAGVCSLGTPLPVLEPAACPASWSGSPDADDDQDGMLDCWEDGTLWNNDGTVATTPNATGLPGIDFDGNGVRDLVLCEPNPTNNPIRDCAQRNRKDLFVEIDYMGNPASTSHRPNPSAITDLQAAFAAAPVVNQGAPSGWDTGIRLHVRVDDVDGPTIDHKDRTVLPPCTVAGAATDANFDAIKAAKFGTPDDRADPNRLNAKRFSYHWVLFAHNQAPDPTNPAGQGGSGCAEIFGNDALVSMGNFSKEGGAHNIGSRNQQASTLLHELGHNLSLRHGGGDNLNCKSNYLSVMNYIFQFEGPVNTGKPSAAPTRWRLDYSRQKLIDLVEGALSEGAGLGTFPTPPGASSGFTVFGPSSTLSPPTAAAVTSGGGVNWDKDGNPAETVQRDINTLGISGCSTAGTFPASAQTLVGFDDWANLQFNFRASQDFADGAHSTIDEAKDGGSLELAHEEVVQISPSSVIDLVPGDAQNRFLKGVPVLPVAILGSDLVEAKDIDPSSATLTIDTNLVARVQRVFGKPACVLLDINHDGKRDLVCGFDVARLQLAVGTHQAQLDATTADGQTLRTGDAFRVIQLHSKD